MIVVLANTVRQAIHTGAAPKLSGHENLLRRKPSYHSHVFPSPYHPCNRSKRVCAYYQFLHALADFSGSGVGYGICQRLLLSFCGGSLPHDVLPQPLATPGNATASEFIPTTKIVLIMACRSPKKATAARNGLLRYLDDYISKQKATAGQKLLAHMKEFRKNLEIDLLQLDLASSKSTLDFGDEVSQRCVLCLLWIISSYIL